MRRPVTTIILAATALALSAAPVTAAERPGASEAAATARATPAASPDVLKLRYGTFRTTKVSGKGTKVIRLPKNASRGLVTIKARGKGDLTVRVLGKNRKAKGRPLVAKRGQPYRGTTIYGMRLAQYDPTFLKVESTSAKKWTVKVAPLHKAKKLKKKHKGTGDAVLRHTLTKSATWRFSHKSQVKGRVGVTTFGLIRTQDLVDKATKRYSSKLRVDDFTGFVEIRSNGTWTLKR